MPANRALRSGTRPLSEYVRCEDFIFRVGDVDGFSHQPVPESESVTVVNFKGYSQSIPDPERRLFDFLVAKLQPIIANETE
jgi:hypothetical protein